MVNRYTCHAEKSAIMNIKNKNILKKCKIYIRRIKYGIMEIAKPCSMCYNLLKKYGITKTY